MYCIIVTITFIQLSKMLSEIRKIISDNHDPRITLLFGLIIVTIMYELGIGVSETYFLSVYDIIPQVPKTDCERKLSFLQMYCFCDFLTALSSFAFGFTCLSRNERYKNLKCGVVMMMGPQVFQIMFALVYLTITIEMESSCRDKLKIDAPKIWTIAMIHIVTSCIFLLILFVITGMWMIKHHCSRCCGQNNERRLQIQEAIYTSDPDDNENNQNIV